ncbi:MAG: T9SS type A sorting domain-containing protein, partial [Bacteroidales bacterium]|nr:T9SS type A sorting domain-containing protein [Bacteroidales bacterium]
VPAINALALQNGIQVLDWNTPTQNWTTAELPDGVHANNASLGAMAAKVNAVLAVPKPVIRVKGTGETAAGDGFAEYRWYKDGVLQSQGASYSFNATEAGSYQLGVKLTSGAFDVIVSKPLNVTSVPAELICKAEDMTTVIEPTSFIQIFPNPVKDFISILGTENTQSFKFYNINGQLVLNSSAQPVDVSGLCSGVYFLKLDNQTVKIVKLD